MKLPPPASNATYAPLVLDMPAHVPVYQFRTTTDPSSLPTELDRMGFVELRCSASSQFSESGIEEIARRLGVPPDRLHVIDLREESHGFLDGNAVSWHANRNWGCVGLSPSEIEEIEALRLRTLALSDTATVGLEHEVLDYSLPAGPGPRIRLGEDPENDAYCIAGIELTRCPTREGRRPRRSITASLPTEKWDVTRVTSERDVVTRFGSRYVRLPVTDHLRPTDARLDDFVDLVRRLPRDAHVHFHCHGGRGRTTTFMVLYDILRNAHVCELDSIQDRSRLLGGYCLCFIPPDFNRDYARERWALFEPFYRYALAEGLEGNRSWSAWQAEQRG